MKIIEQNNSIRILLFILFVVLFLIIMLPDIHFENIFLTLLLFGGPVYGILSKDRFKSTLLSVSFPIIFGIFTIIFGYLDGNEIFSNMNLFAELLYVSAFAGMTVINGFNGYFSALEMPEERTQQAVRYVLIICLGIANFGFFLWMGIN
ncbi:hypothetical protein [Methanolapillus ohkumae]|uniref:Uncharacterized protein n=1 Tax=Methanolapillus ohkumae TaxID=3028298 RepID=A0AA96ZWK8_9EURY|nr:hypothetical protein MsAm2_04480 [Methanosarcinaceae archaeon Am2]